MPLKNFFEEQRNKLNHMLTWISQNQSVAGSTRYDNLEAHLKQLSKKCDEINNNLTSNQNTMDIENYYAMLLYTQSLANRYLEFKQDPEANTGSALEQRRIQGVKNVLSETEESANLLGNMINEQRKARMFEPGVDMVNGQLAFLTSLHEELKASVTKIHSHGKCFGDMMKQLEKTLIAARKVQEQPSDLSKNDAYKCALSQLQEYTNAYLTYKKENNDFGRTSTARIQMAGRLKLMLQDAVPSMASYQTQLEEQQARAWFGGMKAALQNRGVDMSNPILASSVMIMNPREDLSIDRIGQIQTNMRTTPYEEILAYIPMLDRMMQVALVPTDKDGQQLNPLYDSENVADWLLKEIPKTPENPDSYSTDHIVHLYRMAKANRLVLRTNKDGSNEHEIYDRITVDQDGNCVVDDAIRDINHEGKYATEQHYEKYNLTKEAAKTMITTLNSCNKILVLRQFVTAFRVKIEADDNLTDQKRAILKSRYQNLFTDQGLRMIASDFPEWFSNREDAHDLSERCRIHNDSKHQLIEGDAEIIKKVAWQPQELKLAKNILKTFDVKSFDDLRLDQDLKKENGTNYSASNGFRMADAIVGDLLKENRIVYKGIRYKLEDGELREVIQPALEENSGEYTKELKQLINQFRDLSGAPEHEPVDTFTMRFKAWQDAETIRIKALPSNKKKVEQSIFYFVGESFGREKEWDRTEHIHQIHNERSTYQDIVKSVDSFAIDLRMMLYDFGKAKQHVLSDRHFQAIECANQFLDLVDGMNHNMHHPNTNPNLLANKIASRMNALSVKKALLKANDMDDKTYLNTLSMLTNRKTRQEAINRIRETYHIDMIIKKGLDHQLMNLSDEKFMQAMSQMLDFDKKHDAKSINPKIHPNEKEEQQKNQDFGASLS